MWVSENAVYPPLMVNKKKQKNRSIGKVIEITWQRASSFTFTIHDPEMAGMKPPKLEVDESHPPCITPFYGFNCVVQFPKPWFLRGCWFLCMWEGLFILNTAFLWFFFKPVAQFPIPHMVSFSQGALIFYAAARVTRLPWRWPLRWPQQQQPLVLWEVRLLHIEQLALETWRITQVMGG